MSPMRCLSVVLALALALTGPLAPLPAFAQASQLPFTYEDPVRSTEPTSADAVGAGFLNILYVPGKAILCGLGTIAATGLMLLTFGSAYRPAVQVFQDGCHGQWVLTAENVSGKVPAFPDDTYQYE
ncbi:MAG: hypothetical protein L0027_01365 [Candidatus Rokubacteria bacterium]|nr:hypothetical protein [Candidatus Rokubacteria bacterium]